MPGSTQPANTSALPPPRPPPLPEDSLTERSANPLERSVSAPCSPATPPWTPPRRRRIASAEPPSTSWLDVHFVVDVVKDSDGCREIHFYLQLWDRTAHVALSLRRLLFWLALLVVLVPSRAFHLTPRMPGMASRAPMMGSLAVPARLSRLDNITSLDHSPLGIAAAAEAVSLFDTESMLLENSAEEAALMREFDECLLDAASDDDFTACVQQVHASSLDELSTVIVKEGCDLLSAADDGTVVSMLGQVLHTVRTEGVEALGMLSLRRMALRACVSASLHKMTVCALPAVSACMLHVAPNAMHALSSLVQ